MSFYLPDPISRIDSLSAMDSAVLPMLASMEKNGMPVDVVYLNQLGHEFQSELDRIRYQITPYAWPDFNPGSPDQVAYLLFSQLHLRSGKKTKGGKRFTTDDKTLDRLKHDHPVVPLMQSYREYDKLKGTFIDGIIANTTPEFRIHSRLNHARVVSGRLSSSDPNLQNIPAEGDLGK